jgi:hypothetical protein
MVTTPAHAAVRLAGECVPIAVIARGLALPAEDVCDILRTALHEGLISRLPRYDWHPYQMGQLGPLGARSEDEVVADCMRYFKLTRLQASFCTALIRRNEVPKEVLHSIIRRCGQPNRETEQSIKMVDVVVYHLRKRLAKLGLEIKTLWSHGYYMEPAVRRRAQELLSDGQAQEASATVPAGGRVEDAGAPVG